MKIFEIGDAAVFKTDAAPDKLLVYKYHPTRAVMLRRVLADGGRLTRASLDELYGVNVDQSERARESARLNAGKTLSRLRKDLRRVFGGEGWLVRVGNSWLLHVEEFQ